MASSVRRLRLVLAIAAALCLAAPLAASAATRYASPTGTGASPCLQTAPCSIETALSNAGPEGLENGDTVLLAPGTYEPAAELDVPRIGVTVAGEPGQPAPLIDAVGVRGLWLPNVGTVRDLHIRTASSSTSFGLLLTRPGSVVERVESSGKASAGCGFTGTAVRDTVCSAIPSPGAGEGVALFVSGPTVETYETTLTNVTAIGGYTGIGAAANENSTVLVNATNTIASGGLTDIVANSLATTAPVLINLSHSNFEQIETEGTESHVTSPSAAGNQTAAPLFVDEAGGNYREQATSPTRLAGDLAAVLAGETDLAGNPRTTNCDGTIGVDIGAYQYECPTPPLPIPVPPDTGTPNPFEVIRGATAPKPVLAKLALKPAKFVVEGKAPKGVARGTTISFQLDTAASVRLEVLGKPTVKGKKQKQVVLGTLTDSGRAGANHFKFNGKLKGKALTPGAFTLRATAVASGQRSDPETAHFTVLAPQG